MWKIGNVEIENRVVVAPMAGISNSAFRLTVKEFRYASYRRSRASTKFTNFWW